MDGLPQLPPRMPLSGHDLRVIVQELERARIAGFDADEILVSSRRLREDGLLVLGVPVRRSDGVDLNDGMLVALARRPIAFLFEEATT